MLYLHSEMRRKQYECTLAAAARMHVCECSSAVTFTSVAMEIQQLLFDEHER